MSTSKRPSAPIPPEQIEERKKKVVEALTTRFDEPNKLWERAEKILRTIPVPTDVVHKYDTKVLEDRDPQSPDINFYLGFVKSTGGWRICHGTFCEVHEEDINWKPILECPLDTRLAVVPHLNALREKVIQEAEGSLPKIDQAIINLRETLGSW